MAEKFIQFAVRDSNDLYRLELCKTLLHFTEFDFTYFWERCMDAGRAAKKSGHLPASTVSNAKSVISAAHPYIEAMIGPISLPTASSNTSATPNASVLTSFGYAAFRPRPSMKKPFLTASLCSNRARLQTAGRTLSAYRNMRRTSSLLSMTRTRTRPLTLRRS